MSYLLDADVFIQAKNLHYGLDFCPAFWEWLIATGTSGDVYSIDKVFDELLAGADQLTMWEQLEEYGLFPAKDVDANGNSTMQKMHSAQANRLVTLYSLNVMVTDQERAP